jgi:hypothetical protein
MDQDTKNHLNEDWKRAHQIVPRLKADGELWKWTRSIANYTDPTASYTDKTVAAGARLVFLNVDWNGNTANDFCEIKFRKNGSNEANEVYAKFINKGGGGFQVECDANGVYEVYGYKETNGTITVRQTGYVGW